MTAAADDEVSVVVDILIEVAVTVPRVYLAYRCSHIRVFLAARALVVSPISLGCLTGAQSRLPILHETSPALRISLLLLIRILC